MQVVLEALFLCLRFCSPDFDLIPEHKMEHSEQTQKGLKDGSVLPLLTVLAFWLRQEEEGETTLLVEHGEQLVGQEHHSFLRDFLLAEKGC